MLASSKRVFGAVLAAGMIALAGWFWFSESNSGQNGLKALGPDAIDTAAAASGERLDLRLVGEGYGEVVELQFLPGSDTQAVVFDKAGIARLATFSHKPAQGDKSPVWFEVEVRTKSEMGLLGLAFHPKFASNGLFYVNYNPKHGAMRTVIAEWKIDPGAVARSKAVQTRVLLEVEQPYPNHDGGGLAFGPDGMLYIGMGDGGAGGDPLGHGQNLNTLLGAMLRIDVNTPSAGKPYTVPADNPFVGRSGAQPEIWAYGLRNPWRFTFTPNGQLIAADVGQNLWEEVSVVTKGANMGWNVYEAGHCFDENSRCGKLVAVPPVFEYGHDRGASITGGVVYLGQALPALRNKYIFGDYASGRVWAMDLPKRAGQKVSAREIGEWSRSISVFARNASGEILLGDHARGQLLQLVKR